MFNMLSVVLPKDLPVVRVTRNPSVIMFTEYIRVKAHVFCQCEMEGVRRNDLLRFGWEDWCCPLPVCSSFKALLVLRINQESSYEMV